jgi:hypothetical protein
VLGLVLLLLVAVQGAIVYRDHARLRVQAADLIESGIAWAASVLPRQAAPPQPTVAEVRPQPPAPAAAPAAVPSVAPPESPANEPPAAAAAESPVASTTAAPPGPEESPVASTTTPPPVPAESEQPVAPVEPKVAAPPEPSRFTFAGRAVTVGEGETSARIVIRRTGSLAEKESVVWWTANRSALADEDYAVLGAQIETFAPGEELRAVHVPLIADSMPEQRESFVVNLRAERAGAASAAQVEVTIVDDDF